MRKAFLLLSILMFLCTSAIIYLGFALLEPSGANLTIISIISLMGYLQSYIYFTTFKQEKQ